MCLANHSKCKDRKAKFNALDRYKEHQELQPIGSNKLNINSTYIINNLFKTIKKIIIIFTINVLLKMFAKMCD